MGYSGIPDNHKTNVFARLGMIIQFSDEFATGGIPLRNCDHVIDSAVNEKWAGSDTGRTACNTWPRPNGTRSVSLSEFQKGVFTEHLIMCTNAEPMGTEYLRYDFGISCKYVEETVFRLLGTCPAIMKTFCINKMCFTCSKGVCGREYICLTDRIVFEIKFLRKSVGKCKKN